MIDKEYFERIRTINSICPVLGPKIWTFNFGPFRSGGDAHCCYHYRSSLFYSILTGRPTVYVCAIDAAPPRLDGDYQRHLVARVGTTLRLACPVNSARGRTALLVEWWKDGHRVHDGWVGERASV